MQIVVEELHNLDENDLQTSWKELQQFDSKSVVFSTYEWNKAWIDNTLLKKIVPCILLFKHDKKAVGVLPLFQKKYGIIFKYNRLELSSAVELHTDQMDLLCVNGMENQCLSAFSDYLVHNGIDKVVFPYIRKDSRISKCSEIPPINSKFWVYKRKSTVSPYISLVGYDKDKLLQSKKSKSRWSYNNKMKKLDKLEVRYVHGGDTALSLETDLSDLFRLHKKRYDKKKVRSTFGEIEENELLHRNIALEIDNKYLFIRKLVHKNCTIAIIYCFRHSQRIYYYQLGIDTEWDKFSVGKILIYRVLEELVENGYQEFNYLMGNETYKYDWADAEHELISMVMYRKSLWHLLPFLGAKTKAYLKSFNKNQVTLK